MQESLLCNTGPSFLTHDQHNHAWLDFTHALGVCAYNVICNKNMHAWVQIHKSGLKEYFFPINVRAIWCGWMWFLLPQIFIYGYLHYFNHPSSSANTFDSACRWKQNWECVCGVLLDIHAGRRLAALSLWKEARGSLSWPGQQAGWQKHKWYYGWEKLLISKLPFPLYRV